ncbi:MAG: DUF721 domain-containing protein [Gammaproteobacteria bacterium]|jgi:hypothetical protein
MNHPVRIGKYTGGSLYAQLLSRARELMALDTRLHRLLPPPLNEHCSVLGIRDGTLLLAADSPVWASRLRYYSSQLARQLTGPRTVTVRTVRVRVRPPPGPFVPPRRQPPPRLSSRGAALIRRAAAGITDPALQAALLRLAKNDAQA